MPKRLLLIVAMAACTSTSPFDGDSNSSDDVLSGTAPIQTDSLAYTLVRNAHGWVTHIPFEYRNPTSDTIYVVNCNGGLAMSLEERVGNAWRPIWHPVLLMCLSAPITIPPGAVYIDTMAIYGARPNTNRMPEFRDTTFTGTYRIVWNNLVTHYHDSGSGFGDSVLLKYRHSNEFTLRTTVQ